ncbi:MAG TPA: glycoside hydrolase family 27 protein [Solirubrobacteraceae bacterium]|nr:glycoside hydrolase family 27 protein [Solirubrobacteraceae bacterium]
MKLCEGLRAGGARRAAALMAGLLAALCLAAAPAGASSTPPSAAAPTPEPGYAPYMGVDTWYAYFAPIDQQDVVNLVGLTVRRGLRAAGYRYIWLDAGWWYGKRGARGGIVLNRKQWPRGMAWLTEYIHSHGLLAGIYTDMGRKACNNGGSLGHYQQDVNQFAAWGFDAIKGDSCGAAPLNMIPQNYFTRFESAIQHDTPHRRMILNVCNGDPRNNVHAMSAMDDWAWAPKVAASWRTYDDIGWPGGISWAHVLRNISYDARHPGVAGHGHWNDPDYLVPGYLPPEQAQAQFTMWVILAAPLMISADLSTLPRAVVHMLTNHQALAISQDRLGRQGKVVYQRGDLQLWVKPLADGSRAVAVLNQGTTPGSISFGGQMIGLAGQQFTVHEIWQHQILRAAGTMRFRVPATSALLLRISRA